MKKDETRNLNPHKPALVAMWLYGARYAAQMGGSMDFWDKLSDTEKRLCRKLVSEINEAPEE